MGRCDADAPLVDYRGKTWINDDFTKLQDRVVTGEDSFRLQGKYVECLMVATGYGSKQINAEDYTLGVVKLLNELRGYKRSDILGYRNNSHASIITKNQAPKPHPSKHWISNTEDDSVEFFKNLHLSE